MNIPVLILTKDESSQNLLKLFIEENKSFNFLASTDDFEKAFLAVSELKNSVLIIDISENEDFAIDFIKKTVEKNPECKVIALTENYSAETVIKAMREGAAEILRLPLIKEKFLKTLEDIKNAFDGKKVKSDKCKTISVFSNKGGVGKTSIAMNLALELAKNTKENVALVDLNFQLGDVTTFWDLKPTYNLSYMLKNTDTLNKDFLLNTLDKYKDTSLYILADPPYFKQAGFVSESDVENLFKVLKTSFSYIIVDTTSGFGMKTMKALSLSEMVLLLTTMDIPALRNCQRCLELFDSEDFEDDKVKILVNRFMETDDIKIEDVEKLLRKKVFWKIPNNYFTMMSANNLGVPAAEVNKESNVARSFKDLSILISDSIYKQNF
ncbi:AAA family ATPase [bacterium]|nr:AAA family ATPase [bacterium]